MGERITVYFNSRRDKDLLDYLSNVFEGDRSLEIRSLMRDGLKYRKEGKSSLNILPTPTTPNFSRVEREETPLDIEDRLDSI